MIIRAKLEYRREDPLHTICIEVDMTSDDDFILTACLTDYALGKYGYYDNDTSDAFFIFFWRDILIEYFGAKVIKDYDKIYDFYPLIDCGDAIFPYEIKHFMRRYKIAESDIKDTIYQSYIKTKDYKVRIIKEDEWDDIPF